MGMLVGKSVFCLMPNLDPTKISQKQFLDHRFEGAVGTGGCALPYFRCDRHPLLIGIWNSRIPGFRLLRKRGCAPGPHLSANRGDGPVQKGWEDHSAEQSEKLTDEHHLDGIEMHLHRNSFWTRNSNAPKEL